MEGDKDLPIGWNTALKQYISEHPEKGEEGREAAVIGALDTIKDEFRSLVSNLGDRTGLEVLTGFLNDNMPRQGDSRSQYSLKLVTSDLENPDKNS